MDILEATGNTSIVHAENSRWENPTGSLKDRMAEAVISRAEADGRLKPGDTVIEYTGGSTGASLALVCAAKGTASRSSPPMRSAARSSIRWRRSVRELTLVPSEGGLTTKKLILDMIETARELSQEPRHLLDRSAQQPRQHRRLLPARRRDLDVRQTGKVDAFVHCVGHGRFLARGRHCAEATTNRYPNRRRRTRRILSVAWAVSRASQDRRRRALATLRHSGSRRSWTKSCPSRATMRMQSALDCSANRKAV